MVIRLFAESHAIHSCESGLGVLRIYRTDAKVIPCLARKQLHENVTCADGLRAFTRIESRIAGLR